MRGHEKHVVFIQRQLLMHVFRYLDERTGKAGGRYTKTVANASLAVFR